MKQFFGRDSIWVGIVAGIGSMAIFCLMLYAGLLIAKQPPVEHIRWFGGMFIPLIIILRAYAKSKEHLTVTRTLIVIFFLSFIAFIFYLFHTHAIAMK